MTAKIDNDQDEQTKTQVRLTTNSKQRTRLALRDFKTVKSKGKPKIVTPQPFPCSACGKSHTRPIAPPGIWFCDEHYFMAVMAQLADRKARLFLDTADIAAYQLAVEVLGPFGTELPPDPELQEIRAKMPFGYNRNVQVMTQEYGTIWFGDVRDDDLKQLERRLGAKATLVSLSDVSNSTPQSIAA